MIMELVVVACSLSQPLDCDELRSSRRASDTQACLTYSVAETLLWMATRPDKVIYSMTCAPREGDAPRAKPEQQ